MNTYTSPTEPGDTQRTWRYLGMWQAADGQIRIEVLERDATMRKDGSLVSTDLGALPTPYDPAEMVEVPGLSQVPAGAIVGAVSAWIRAKQDARDTPPAVEPEPAP